MKFRSEPHFLRWDFVKGISDNELSKVIGAVPLVGYLILFNDQMVEALNFLSIAGVDSDMPSPFFLGPLSKLKLTFFGSLSLFGAFIVCRVFCPRELYESREEFGFSGRVRDFYSVYEIASMEKKIMSESWVPRLREFWIVFDKARSRKLVVSGFRPDVRQHMFATNGDYIGFLSREWWQGQLHAAPLARLSCLFLASIGYLFLAIPTFDITQAVVANVVF